MKHEARVEERGVAAVEFALVLPLLLVLVLGAIDWGYYFTVREVAIHAAREGARTASLVGNSTGDGVTVANQFLSDAGFCIGGAQPPTGAVAAGAVAVEVTCANVVLTKFFPAALVPRTLTVSAQIRHE